MKVLTRDFTLREKILLLILGLIIIAALYYLLVYQAVEGEIKMAEDSAQMLEDEITLLDAQLAQANRMQQEMDELERTNIESYMPTYNSKREEMEFLNRVLSITNDYYVGFSAPTREGDQVRRDFSLQYKTDNYPNAVSIIDALEKSDIRCAVGDVSYSPDGDSDNLIMDEIQVNCSATFFETAHGATEDQELPAEVVTQPAEEAEEE